MDKSRKQFESWLVRNHSDTCNNINFEINSKGDYRYFSTRLAWEAWQASRESLGVELPSDVITGHDGMFDEGLAIGYNNALEECKEILDSNGVKVK